MMVRTLYRYSNWLLFAYVGGAVTSMLLIESVFNGGFWESLRWLWLPLALAIFGFTWINRRLYVQTGRPAGVWLVAVAFYPFAILMTWPYVMALNAARAGRL